MQKVKKLPPSNRIVALLVMFLDSNKKDALSEAGALNCRELWLGETCDATKVRSRARLRLGLLFFFFSRQFKRGQVHRTSVQGPGGDIGDD